MPVNQTGEAAEGIIWRDERIPGTGNLQIGIRQERPERPPKCDKQKRKSANHLGLWNEAATRWR
jgi:hypothetical protein